MRAIVRISMIMMAGCAGPNVPITARTDGTFFENRKHWVCRDGRSIHHEERGYC